MADDARRRWLGGEAALSGLLDPQPLGERGGQQQPGRGDGVLVVEGDIDLVQHHVRGWHRKGVLRLGDRDCLAAVILPGQGTLFTISPSPPHHRPVDRGSGQGQPADLLDRCQRLSWHRVPELDRTRDRGHGRIEIRTLKAVSISHFGFPHAAQVLQVTRKTRASTTTRGGARP